MDTTEEQFNAAVKVVQSLPKNGGTFQPSTSLMLTFYAYYKQATQGVCNTARPAFYDVVGRAKWDAWKQLGNLTSEEAMKEYVNELKKIVETMPQTDVVQDFIEKLGNFYEMVDENDDRTNQSSKRSIGEFEPPRSGTTNCSSNLDRQNGCHVDEITKESTGGHLDFLTGRQWSKALYANGMISTSEFRRSSEGSKVIEVDESSEDFIENTVNGGLDTNVICEDDERDDKDDERKDKDDERNDKDDEHNDKDDERKGDDKDKGRTEHLVECDTVDDDEFCDTTDVFFHNQEEQTHFLPLSSSEARESSRIFGKADAFVQTDELLTYPMATIDNNNNDDVLFKVNKAVEDLQRNVVELEKQVFRLNELQSKKVETLEC